LYGLAGFLLDLPFNPKDGGDIFFRNVGLSELHYTNRGAVSKIMPRGDTNKHRIIGRYEECELNNFAIKLASIIIIIIIIFRLRMLIL
jgi:hypothetical protein